MGVATFDTVHVRPDTGMFVRLLRLFQGTSCGGRIGLRESRLLSNKSPK